MSRTRKDAPSRVRFPEPRALYKRTKKRKEVLTDWQWLWCTPSWWVRIFMNRPQRRKTRVWEQDVKRTPIEQLEEVEKPNVSRKPHKYYW